MNSDLATILFMSHLWDELKRARKKFPGDDVTFTALVEETGELAKALLDEKADRVWHEAIQTAAMALRVAVDGDNSYDFIRGRRNLGTALYAESEAKQMEHLLKIGDFSHLIQLITEGDKK